MDSFGMKVAPQEINSPCMPAIIQCYPQSDAYLTRSM